MNTSFWPQDMILQTGSQVLTLLSPSAGCDYSCWSFNRVNMASLLTFLHYRLSDGSSWSNSTSFWCETCVDFLEGSTGRQRAAEPPLHMHPDRRSGAGQSEGGSDARGWKPSRQLGGSELASASKHDMEQRASRESPQGAAFWDQEQKQRLVFFLNSLSVLKRRQPGLMSTTGRGCMEGRV